MQRSTVKGLIIACVVASTGPLNHADDRVVVTAVCTLETVEITWCDFIGFLFFDHLVKKNATHMKQCK